MEQSIIEKTVHAIKGRSIFLIGMMGSGKSQTGLKLAELLKYKYIDLDSLIENLAKKSINQIFNDEGENNLLVKLINKRNDIVLREELADQEFDETELRKVDVQVTRLRQKIETNAKQPQFIKTIRGKGYKLICNEF